MRTRPLGFAALAFVACGEPSEPPAPPPVRVEVIEPAEGAPIDGPALAVRTRVENLREPLRFELDGRPLAEPVLPIASLSEGAHRLVVRTSGTSPVERGFVVDRSPPALEVLAPGSRVLALGRWRIDVRVTDATGVRRAIARSGTHSQALAPVAGTTDRRAGVLVVPPLTAGATLPVPVKVVVEADDALGHRTTKTIEASAGLLLWALTFGVEPGAYELVPARDGGFLVLTGGSVVRVGATGEERFAWKREGGVAADAVALPGGGAVVRFVATSEPAAAEVVALDRRGAEIHRWSGDDRWPLAIAAVNGGVAVAWRMAAGSRLTRLPLAGPAAGAADGEALPAEPRALRSLPDGGVLLRYARSFEARAANGSRRWTRPANPSARAFVARGTLAIVDGRQVELVDSASGEARGAYTARSPAVVVRHDGFLVTSRRHAVLLGPDARPRWTLTLPRGARVSADGRVAWTSRRVLALSNGSRAQRVDREVFAAAGAGDGVLLIVAAGKQTPPEARVLAPDGTLRYRENLAGYRWLDETIPVPTGLLLHARTPVLPGPGRPRPPIARLLRIGSD